MSRVLRNAIYVKQNISFCNIKQDLAILAIVSGVAGVRMKDVKTPSEVILILYHALKDVAINVAKAP